MPIGKILEMVNRATELVDEGLAIYESVKNVVDDAGDTIENDDLQEAKTRLERSRQKAITAADRLNAAIDARLG
jgi:hypothetical protein